MWELPSHSSLVCRNRKEERFSNKNVLVLLKDNRLCVGSVYSWTSEDVILGAVPRTCAEAARARGQLGTHLTSVGQKVSN